MTQKVTGIVSLNAPITAPSFPITSQTDRMALYQVTEKQVLGYYDQGLDIFGDTARGAGWPNDSDRDKRFDVILDIITANFSDRSLVLCDLGCGTGELYRRIRERRLDHIVYKGVDASEIALGYARSKFPDITFHCFSALTAETATLQRLACDVLVANGLFTVKSQSSQADMWDFMTGTLQRAWPLVGRGLIFNVMSKVVDWERDDLFHVSYDELARFLHDLAGRAIGFRADYGLYEFMAYALKQPVAARNAAVKPGKALPPGTPPSQAPSHAPLVEPFGELSAAPSAADTTLPVLRPLLPASERVAHYLKHLDQTRRYTNHGDLVRALESRLVTLFAVAPGQVVSAASGTAALVGAILASAGRAQAARPYCICPSYTFIGTASAIEQCGYQLLLVDIDEDDWAFHPDRLRHHPLLSQVGLVVTVAPYGRAPAPAGWLEFRHRTGIPVVIDAAAAFEAVSDRPDATITALPMALSFHATKVFSTGEGGAVLCTDQQIAVAARRALNFGFLGARISHGPSINGKMSEYHGAVGLAELDGWQAKRSAYQRVAQAYQREAEAASLGRRFHTAPVISSCYCLFQAADRAEALAVCTALDRAHVEFRTWYNLGLHQEPNFRSCARDTLTSTDRIAPLLIGLPVAPDLPQAEIRRVVTLIATART